MEQIIGAKSIGEESEEELMAKAAQFAQMESDELMQQTKTNFCIMVCCMLLKRGLDGKSQQQQMRIYMGIIEPWYSTSREIQEDKWKRWSEEAIKHLPEVAYLEEKPKIESMMMYKTQMAISVLSRCRAYIYNVLGMDEKTVKETYEAMAANGATEPVEESPQVSND